MKPMTETQLIERDERFDIQFHTTWSDEDFIAETAFVDGLERWDLEQQRPKNLTNEATDPRIALSSLLWDLRQDPNRVRRLCEVDELIKSRERGEMHDFGARHRWAKPLVDAFTHDLSGWAKFVREIWTSLTKRSPESMELRESCLRLIEERLDAQIRREREARLIRKCEIKHGPFQSSKDKDDYFNQVHEQWSVERCGRLSDARATSPSGKLTAEQQKNICDQFWKEIDRRIQEGDIPESS